eukprot:TRINITY_DN8540_c0_g1_i2.p1 TRINITY_DN8540_c0_g1~~TRINITY_DN8540_c0_g1_i2.p1  ORF type:complete len:653 (+),score=197.05 TRINITY_DN8540_c0_g1_i2:440-2398(+)
MRTAKKLGIKTVAVYSEADKNSMHVDMADEAYYIGPSAARESYLRGEKIVEIAIKSGSHAVHPGYGFLSENEVFAGQLEKANITFIGPPSFAIRTMGNKSESKKIMSSANVPVVPGYHGENQDPKFLKEKAKEIKYPVLIKATYGGGGKGMRIVEDESQFDEALEGAKREAMSSFGNDEVLVEKYIKRPRHIELQVFGDKHKNYVYLFERDCSLQRRHQKVLEEAPAPHMTPELREQMGSAAVRAAAAVHYVGAGTVEFIFDCDTNEFYFMEMNTRLQVEHPITEMITGQDLVEWQILVAQGGYLPLDQTGLIKRGINGHAIEARIYAENPDQGFLPGTGRLEFLRTPALSDYVRIDTGVRENDEVSVYYDPMIAKLIVWGNDRTVALRRMSNALESFNVAGLNTNIEFLHRCLKHEEFVKGNVDTSFINRHKSQLINIEKSPAEKLRGIILAAAKVLLHEATLPKTEIKETPWDNLSGLRINSVSPSRIIKLNVEGDKNKPIEVRVTYHSNNSFTFSIDDKSYLVEARPKSDSTIRITVDGHVKTYTSRLTSENIIKIWEDDKFYSYFIPSDVKDNNAGSAGSLVAPMPGKITKVSVKVGQHVNQGDPLIIMEAMKMEHIVRAPFNGKVTKVFYKVGDLIPAKGILVNIEQ